MVILGKLPQLWVTPNDHPDTSRVRTQHIDHRAYPYKATAFEDSLHTSSTVDVRSLKPPTKNFKYKGQKMSNLRFVYAIVTEKHMLQVKLLLKKIFSVHLTCSKCFCCYDSISKY